MERLFPWFIPSNGSNKAVRQVITRNMMLFALYSTAIALPIAVINALI